MKRFAYWAGYAVFLHWMVRFMQDDELAERWARRLYRKGE